MLSMSTIDQQFVEFIVKSLVGKPDEVVIARSIDEKGVLLELTVNAEDLGRVIGKRGATAQSIRTLLRALGTKNEARYNLKIVDTANGRPLGRPTNDSPDKSEQPSDDQIDQINKDDKTTDQTVEVDLHKDSAINQPEDNEQTETSDVISKTRKELEDLDDLDV